MKEEKNSIIVSKNDQIKVSEELIENSRLTYVFYVMLVFSTIIVTLGLLIDNYVAIIGGMLITPLLTPILTIALGVVLADKTLIFRSSKIFLKSFLIIILVSFLFSFLFPVDHLNGEIHARLESNILFFLIAFVAGMAGTFAWTKKNMSEVLPGVAIAVSLVPPACVLGIGISYFDLNIIRGSFVSFLLNLLGIIFGSVVIFSLLNFHKVKKETVKVVKQEIREDQRIKDEKIKKEIVAEIKIEKEVTEDIKKEVIKEVEEEIKKNLSKIKKKTKK
jgi:uncharacterized hydrophobic protein (TIGR00271 family)